jgi:hypothetical protein
MFFDFLTKGRKNGDLDRLKKAPPRSEQITPAEVPADENLAEVDAGRGSYTKLRSVAKEQRIRQQGTPKDSLLGLPVTPKDSLRGLPASGTPKDSLRGLPAASDQDTLPASASVPEEERMKAIAELLNMGVDHFSTKRKTTNHAKLNNSKLDRKDP